MKFVEIFKVIQGALAVLGGLGASFIGGLDGLIYALLIFVCLDILLGIMISISEKKLSSSLGFKGLCKKVLMFAFIGVGHTLDVYVLGGTPVLRSSFALFFIGNEGISIIENSAVMGLPLPDKLKDILIQLREGKATTKNITKK